MPITINANDIHDASHQLGLSGRRSGINIQWRCLSHYRFHEHHEVGCIVDATDIEGEEVKRCFPSSKEALRYIAALLKRHDIYARDCKKKQAKEARDKIKKDKKAASCNNK